MSSATMALCERDKVLPVVPMFHANAWGLPYASVMAGASFVLQDIYGLSALAFGLAFAGASCGFLAGNVIATRIVQRIGLDLTIGIGSLLLAAGGLAALAAVALGTINVVGGFVVTDRMLGMFKGRRREAAGAEQQAVEAGRGQRRQLQVPRDDD